jgi:predicted transcriptional regulator
VSEQKDVLRGLTLKVYKFVLRSDRPVGIREVQRALGLSSPTLALYHLNKLEEAGLIKKEANGYIADRVILENLFRFRRILIRWEKRADTYIAMLHLALGIITWRATGLLG